MPTYVHVMRPKLATELLWWLWVKRLFEKIKQTFFHTCGQKDGESHRSTSLCKMDSKNNGTRPCKETSFSVNNHKHAGLIITRSFSYASCCFVVYDPLFTSSLPPVFEVSGWGQRIIKRRRALVFFSAAVVALRWHGCELRCVIVGWNEQFVSIYFCAALAAKFSRRVNGH